jgi:hypothetical protein
MTPLTRKVLLQHNVNLRAYESLDKHSKIAISTQYRRWGKLVSVNLQKELMFATLKEAVQ